MTETMTADAPSRLERLLSYLQHDPANLSLLQDAAVTALDENQLAEAARLIRRYGAAAPLTPAMINLAGLLALREGRFADAQRQFESLLAGGAYDAGLHFNLAWARMMQANHEGALELLDDAVIAVAPAAAGLKIQALHHLGRLEEALEIGEVLADVRPGDQALASALAVVAIDANRPDLARHYALAAGDTHEGLSTLGALALTESDVNQAAALFDRALAANPNSGRAILGRGMVSMARGHNSQAAMELERAAETFGGHLGSWVAAGWACLAAGDSAGSRALFEKALAIDDTFAETHGALAVLDVMEGRLMEAERRLKVALRLDRECFSAALARTLMATAKGDPASAERIRAMALSTQVGPGGQTLGQAMAALMAGAKS